MLHLVIVLTAAAPAAPDAVPAPLAAPPPIAMSVGWSGSRPGAPITGWLSGRRRPPSADPEAQPASEPNDVPPALPAPAPPFEQVLDEAKARYFQGDTEHARELLEGLQLRLYQGEEPAWELVVDALIYLGEIYYGLGLHDQAQIAFRYVLERDPQTPISPFHHSMELVNLFELVRTTVLAGRQEEPPPPPPIDPKPLPAWAFLPLGVPQMLQGRTGAGIAYGLLQAGLGAASIGLYVHTSRVNPEPGAPGTDPQISRDVDRLKYTMQWPATFGFYGVWGLSLIDAAVWHARHPQGKERRRGSAALPDSAAVPVIQVRGRF